MNPIVVESFFSELEKIAVSRELLERAVKSRMQKGPSGAVLRRMSKTPDARFVGIRDPTRKATSMQLSGMAGKQRWAGHRSPLGSATRQRRYAQADMVGDVAKKHGLRADLSTTYTRRIED